MNQVLSTLPGILYKYRYRIIVALVAMVAVVVMFAHDTHATMAQNSRLRYGNAWDYCHMPENESNGRYWAWGMVWLSNNESDYYSEDVNIGTNDNSVRVSVRGAANTCETSFSRTTSFYAIRVTASVLTGLSSDSFYRGDAPPYARYTWTTEGSKLYGDINVSGVATCSPDNMSGRATGQVTIYLTRTQYQTYQGGGDYTSPDPATEAVPVNVTRTCPTYNYNLQPSIGNISDNSVVELPKSGVPIQGYVRNDGPTISRPNIDWQITKVRYPKGAAIPQKGGGDSGDTVDPCKFFNSWAACDPVNSGQQSPYYPSNNTVRHDGITDIQDYEVGTRICFALSVRQYRHDQNGWRHSQLYCYVVGKYPKVQVLGGDLLLGRSSGTNAPRTSSVTTSVSSRAGKIYGSWSEYGIASSGLVRGMGSAAGYAGGGPTDDLCSVSLLTLTNATASGCVASTIGKYTQGGAAPNVSARFPLNTSTTQLPSNNVDITANNLSGLYTTSASSLSVKSSGQIPTKRWVVINAPNTTVTISGNIQYTDGSLSAVTDIPQVVIIARTIIIADSVTNIDAWLVANGAEPDGRINTCGAGGVGETTPLTADTCKQPLTVNGPVVANHLILRRTAGSGTGTGAADPAEVFNLRADAYIWASSYSPGTGRLPTVSTKELPPRF